MANGLGDIRFAYVLRLARFWPERSSKDRDGAQALGRRRSQASQVLREESATEGFGIRL
jgi:hypothetical protein